MKALFFLLAALSLSLGAFFASAHEAPQVEGAAATSPLPSSELTTSSICHDVEVAVDEGYGVSGHETRRECAPKD